MSEGAAVFSVLVICAAVFLILARPFREAGPPPSKRSQPDGGGTDSRTTAGVGVALDVTAGSDADLPGVAATAARSNADLTGPHDAAGTPRITPPPPPGPPIHTASLAAADGAGGRQAPARPAGDRTQLLDEKDRLFQALADLRFDYEAGKLSLEDFEEEDGHLRARAAALLHELGNGAPRNIPPTRA